MTQQDTVWTWVAWCGLTVALAATSSWTSAASGARQTDARQIVAEAQRRGESTAQRYEGMLQVFDAKGKIADKRWTFERLGSHGRSKAVLRFSAPPEVKGVALLIVNHPDRASDQWLWTPAIERDRRIALQDRSTRFFGTDFSFEDLEERDVDQFAYDARRRGGHRRPGVLEDRVDAERDEVLAVHAVHDLDSQGQLRLGTHRELHQGRARPTSELRRHPQRAGDLDRAPARNARPGPRQPDATDHRQAAVQPPAQGRGLHRSGIATAVAGRTARMRWHRRNA